VTGSRTCFSCLLSLLYITTPGAAWAVDCAEIEYQGTRSTVCHVDVRTERLRLFLKDESGAPFTSFRKLAQALTQHNEQLVFAMNAGMYREDYTPVGLMVSEGRQVHRLNQATGFGNFYLKPNGIFLLAASGARIIETGEYASLSDPALLATQSGPLLLHNGRINSNISPQGTSRLIRNGVGVTTSNKVVFAISEEPVNFYDFALLFRDRLQCPDALYLDGNVSSLYARSLGRDDERVPIGPIIGVTASRPAGSQSP
jgi:uncharacterized protein YigE (DUF2233 family)